MTNEPSEGGAAAELTDDELSALTRAEIALLAERIDDDDLRERLLAEPAPARRSSERPMSSCRQRTTIGKLERERARRDKAEEKRARKQGGEPRSIGET